MKYYLSVLFIVVFCACQSDYTTNKVIIRSEELMNTRPDSSYILLNSIKNPEQLSKADYAAWCLQFTHAQLKTQKEIKSTKLIQESLKYYSSNKKLKEYGISWYLLGCVLRKQNKNKEAILAFKEAESHLKSTNENKIKGLIAYNIGFISMQDELYNYSLDYLKKSLLYFKLAKEKRYEAYSYNEISNMYYQLNYPSDSIIYYLNLAIKLSKESNDSLNYFISLGRKSILIRESETKLAKQYMLDVIKFLPNQKQIYSSYLAYVYSKLNQSDSARYYLNFALKQKFNSTYQIINLHSAALISKNTNNYIDAYNYLETSYVIRDSIYQKNLQAQLYRVDKQFNLSEKEKENVELQLKNRNSHILIISLILFLLILFAFALTIYNRNKLKNTHNELANKKLEFENEIIKNKYELKQQLILTKLNQNIENTLEFDKLKKEYKDSAKREEFQAQLGRKWLLTEDVWKQYIDEVNSLYDNCIYILKKRYGLTNTDMIVIALICLNVNLHNSCVLLNMERNTMYTRRKTIKKRLELNPEVELELWINEFITEHRFSNNNSIL